MPKRKQFAHPKKNASSKKSAPEPQTEQDFLQLADDHEQAGGKWRKGDPAKAARFFQRALEAYDEGLQMFPQSFDLAYDKAHLQFEISQQRSIAASFGPTLTLLRQALDSHRYAMKLQGATTDVLFNTAQVLNALAEELEPNDVRAETSESRAERSELLNEALSILQECTRRQRDDIEKAADLSKSTTSGLEMEDGEDAMDLTASEVSGDGGEEWATVYEPATVQDLVDTLILIIETSTNSVSTHLLSDLQHKQNLDQLAATTDAIANRELPPLISQLSSTSSPDRTPSPPPSNPTISISSLTSSQSTLLQPLQDSTNPRDAASIAAALASANFTSAVADLQLRAHTASPTTALDSINAAFGEINSEDARLAHADALMSFARITTPPYAPVASETPLQHHRWSALSAADQLLASSSRATSDIITVLARSDVGLMRFYITEMLQGTEGATDQMRSSAGQLLDSAGELCGRALELVSNVAGNTVSLRGSWTKAPSEAHLRSEDSEAYIEAVVKGVMIGLLNARRSRGVEGSHNPVNAARELEKYIPLLRHVNEIAGSVTISSVLEEAIAQGFPKEEEIERQFKSILA